MLTYADVCLGDGEEVSSRCRTHAANAARTQAEPQGGEAKEELAAAVARAPSAELVRLLPDINAARVVACRYLTVSVC
jgi:hypothetical protein